MHEPRRSASAFGQNHSAHMRAKAPIHVWLWRLPAGALLLALGLYVADKIIPYGVDHRRQISALKATWELKNWIRAGADQSAFQHLLTNRPNATWTAVSTTVVADGVKIDGMVRIESRSLGPGHLLVSTNGSAAWIAPDGKAHIVYQRPKQHGQQ